MIRQIVARVLAFVAYMKGRKAVVRTATVLTVAATPILVGGTAHATAPVDPLNGAGQGLVDDLLTNFTTYVIPAVAGVILAVIAWKMIVKLGTRFFNRA